MQMQNDPRATVAALLATAADHPGAEALRHKRRGVWRSWSRADLRQEVATLTEALGARGVRDGAVVAVSGEYGPDLLFIAIAAIQVGALVLTVPPGTGLADWVARHRPVLVYLGLRDQAGAWRAALLQAGLDASLVVDAPLPWAHEASEGFAPAAELLQAEGTPSRPTSAVLWIEETTDWAQGLATILRAAAEGRTIAFPESRLAAHRDRAETQPVALAVSPSHQAALSADLSSRLAIGGGVAAWLTRAVLASGRRGRPGLLASSLLGRLRRPLGLARARELIVVGERQNADGADLFASLGIPPVHATVPEAVSVAAPAPGLALA